jgi:hypothetical protein
MMPTIDTRLTTAGITVTVPQLVAIWADHTPAHTPVPGTCPSCGHTYTTKAPLCPTAAIVRPLLLRRRREVHPRVFEPLTYNQHEDLFGKRLSTGAVPRSLPVTDTPPRPTHQVVDLFGGA